MQKPLAPVEVFYSCSDSPIDAPLLEQLEKQLHTLQRDGVISTWHKRQIIPGTVRQIELDRHLNSAKLILLLISIDFLASDYCYQEMKRALQRHEAGEARVIPILLRPCYWEDAPFAEADLEILPTNHQPITQWNQSKREAAWLDVLVGIRRLLGVPTASRVQSKQQDDVTIPARKGTPMQEQIKALFLAANASDPRNRLAIDEEMRSIEQKIRMADHRDALIFQSSWAVRPDDLLQLLNQHRPQIVHFSGHGNMAGLSLAGDDGQNRLVSTRALAALFTTLKDNIRLVFLNSCYSREQGLALVKQIDCVVGMKESIGDQAAIVFSSSFYRALGFGRSIQQAFEQGLVSLMVEDIPEEDIPELLHKDGVDPAKIVLIRDAPNP